MAKQDTVDTGAEPDTGAEVHDLMTVKQAAEYLQVNPKTLYRWLAAGKVPGVRLGDRSWRVKRATLAGWVRQQTREAISAGRMAARLHALAGLRELRERMRERNGGPLPSGYGADLIREGRR